MNGKMSLSDRMTKVEVGLDSILDDLRRPSFGRTARPFKAVSSSAGWYVVAPALSSKAIGPFSSRQQARAKATEWNRKYDRDGASKALREELAREASAEDGALRLKEESDEL